MEQVVEELIQPKKGNNRPGTPQKKVDGKALIPEVISAALGAQTFRKATRAMSQPEMDSLGRALGQDVDQWRREFSASLRRTGVKLLEVLERDIELIKPDARAYTLAVLVDKASALEGRSQLNGSAVNIQVNNYGLGAKDELMKQLFGQIAKVDGESFPATRAEKSVFPSAETSSTDTNTQTDTNTEQTNQEQVA